MPYVSLETTQGGAMQTTYTLSWTDTNDPDLEIMLRSDFRLSETSYTVVIPMITLKSTIRTLETMMRRAQSKEG